MRKAFASVNELALKRHVHNRLAAHLLAVQRISDAMKVRGWV
jgi:glutamate dehydrogenase/leucine dehydrogenase